LKVELHRIQAAHNPVALLHYEPRRPRGISVVAGHGYSSGKQNLDFLCAFLATHGFGVYSLDFPGHKLGASGGELRGIDDCIDAMAATAAFAREHAGAPLYAMGHSMGAMTALFFAALEPSVLGAVSIATGYGRPSAMAKLMKVASSDFRSSYVVGVTLPQLLEGVDERFDSALPRIAGRPVLFVAANRDAMVSASSVRELYDRAAEPKALETIDSDHTYAAEHARATVLQWLDERHPRR
jgi:alpha-beta hydrolase superfamily lysophospholipase